MTAIERRGLAAESQPFLRSHLGSAALVAALLFFGVGQRTGHAQTDDPAEAERHGRRAQAPGQIPLAGWKDIFYRLYGQFSRDRVLAIAAGVTFYGLLAIFPAIAALVSIYGLFADPESVTRQLDALSGILPGGAMEIIGGQMMRVAEADRGALGFTFVGSLLVSIWSANAGMKAIFDALNVVYGEEEKRGFIKLNAISLLFTVGLIVILLAVLAGTVVLPAVLSFLGLPRWTEFWVRLLPWPLLLLLVTIGIGLIYRFGPSREHARWRWISWGSAFAAVGWLAASLLFSWYAANFGNFNETYGSLGAAIGFMIWMWVSTIVLLMGAELNAVVEHQTAQDSTVGRPQPMGKRGAHVADTLGRVRV